MKKREKIVVLLLFLLQIFLLLYISDHKPLWNDESFSVLDARGFSLGRFLSGNSGEGNTAPLYFLLLKLLLWLQEFFAGSVPDPTAYLRLMVSILPAAAVGALIEIRFMKLAGSFWAKVLIALCMFLALNGATAFLDAWQVRHYSLWMLSTWMLMQFTFKALFSDEKPSPTEGPLIGLFGGLLISMALLQLALSMVAISLFGLNRRKENIRNAASLLPGALLALYYALCAPKYSSVWPGLDGIFLLLNAHAKYWLVLPLVAAVGLIRKNKRALPLTALTAGVAGIVGVIVFNFYLRSLSDNPIRYELANRYFVFLLPMLLAILAEALSLLKGKQNILCVIFFAVIGVQGGARVTGNLLHQGERRSVAVEKGLQDFSGPGEKCFCVTKDKRNPAMSLDVFGAYSLVFQSWGRNCTKFEEVRAWAPQNVLGELFRTGRTFNSVAIWQLCDAAELPPQIL